MIRNRTKISIINFIFILTLMSSATIVAQETVVVGQILNKADKSPIPSVNIFFKNSQKGTQSNDEGYFLIKDFENHNVLIFSTIGFKMVQIKVKPGQSVGIQVEMDEENTELQELFVLPGANPALEIMKKVRTFKKQNDISSNSAYTALSTEQNLVLLSKISTKSGNRKIFNQLKKGNISSSDSSLIIPLYMDEQQFKIAQHQKELLSKNIFSSQENNEKLYSKLVGDFTYKVNFYENVVPILGKGIISPIASNANLYYHFYLIDSTLVGNQKTYEIHFRSKNTKNLAFDGKVWIDAESYSITRIEAELPNTANFNFVNNLQINQFYEPLSPKVWSIKNENLSLTMASTEVEDKTSKIPELFIKRTTKYTTNDSLRNIVSTFADSNYETETLESKLNELNNTPVMRTAKFLATSILTGYMPFRYINVGRIQQIVRFNTFEGLRLTFPFMTNANLWENFSVGGYLGYGFKNNELKYSGSLNYKFNGNLKRNINFYYTNDYKRIDWSENDYIARENPLVNGDEDFTSSVLSNSSAPNINLRHETGLSFSNDWNKDIESSIYLRRNKIFATSTLPYSSNGFLFNQPLLQHSATLFTRFSFGEKVYDDNSQRIYITNNSPVIYAITELGNYEIGSKKGNYVKILGAVKQNIRLIMGYFNYVVQAGYVLNEVPYPLLEIQKGNETVGYSLYRFSLMNYMEFPTDKFINLHTELRTNGILMNQIPVIKHLNLREIISFKLLYGSLSNQQNSIIDLPTNIHFMNAPYIEMGVGLTNIFQILSLQSIWRVTNLNQPIVTKWGIKGSINLEF